MSESIIENQGYKVYEMTTHKGNKFLIDYHVRPEDITELEWYPIQIIYLMAEFGNASGLKLVGLVEERVTSEGKWEWSGNWYPLYRTAERPGYVRDTGTAVSCGTWIVKHVEWELDQEFEKAFGKND